MKKNTILFSLLFVVLIALGIIFNAGIRTEKVKIAEKKFTEDMLLLLPNLEANKLEEVKVTPSDKETKIVRKFKALKDETLVGYIYVGETKGYQAGLQVAYGIDSKLHKVTGAKIVNSNETSRFLEALANSNFYDQFKNIDLKVFNLKLKRLTVGEAKTGATPNGGNKNDKDVIAPATTAGFEKILLSVREEYANDNNKFTMPKGLSILSKNIDYINVNQFLYVFKTSDEKQVDVVVNDNYEIITISDETQRLAVVELLSDDNNKMVNYIDSATTVGTVTTLVILTKSYVGNVKATVTIDNGTITSTSIDYTAPQTYTNDYNDKYFGGDYSNAPQQLKDNIDIPVVAGATRTHDGLKTAQSILRKYLEVNYE